MNTFLSGIFGIKKSESYVVVRINKASQKKQILKSNLSREEAMKLAKKYPSNSRSQVVFVKESNASNFLQNRNL